MLHIPPNHHMEWAVFNVKDIYKDGFIMSKETAIESGKDIGDIAEKYRNNGDVLFTNIWVPDKIGGMENGKKAAEEADEGAEAGSESEGTEDRKQAAKEGDTRPEP